METTRKMLTAEEYNAINHWLCNTHMDEALNVSTEMVEGVKDDYYIDVFEDLEERKILSLKEGLEYIRATMAYPLEHDVSPEEARIIEALFKEFGVE